MPNDIKNIINLSLMEFRNILRVIKSFVFNSDNLYMTATLNSSDLRITTIFKNNRNNSCFKNIEEEKMLKNL